MPYRLIRFYADSSKHSENIGVVSSLEEAQEHCNDPETSASSATSEEAQQRTRQFGDWFDGYEEI